MVWLRMERKNVKETKGLVNVKSENLGLVQWRKLNKLDFSNFWDFLGKYLATIVFKQTKCPFVRTKVNNIRLKH